MSNPGNCRTCGRPRQGNAGDYYHEKYCQAKSILKQLETASAADTDTSETESASPNPESHQGRTEISHRRQIMTVHYEKYEGRIPPHTLKALRNYIEYGVPTGEFLRSVLADSLFGAFGKADSDNRESLGDIVMFVYNEAPGGCWGSADHIKKWLEKEGRQGRDAQPASDPEPVGNYLRVTPPIKMKY